MSSPEAPWGEESFERDRNWYQYLGWRGYRGDEKKFYAKFRQNALEEPTFDLFDKFMPTGKPKYDIGRYVMQHAINVPLINSFSEWQSAITAGRAMLRSELPQDYDGYSGLLSSNCIDIDRIYPRDERGYEFVPDHWANERPFEGPVYDKPTMRYGWRGSGQRLQAEKAREIDDFLIAGLRNGTINPAYALEMTSWTTDMLQLSESAAKWRYKIPIDHFDFTDGASASRWHYIPGKNLKVMRDPVVEGKYYVGVTGSHHYIWRLENGRDSGDMYAYHWKNDHFGAYHGGENTKAKNEPEFHLPTDRIIDLYEKVRTLPYFDTTQAPLMELQYGDDGKLYFLQYLKTGRTIGDSGEFALPTGERIITIHNVSGATSSEGEQVRIYLDPPVFTQSMKDQAFYMDDNLESGHEAQAAAMMARICIQNYDLSFKDNHFSSAPLVRPPLAVGLWDGVGDGEKQFNSVTGGRFRPDTIKDVRYINAIVTSNGRTAAVDSDWEVRIESVN